MRGAVRGLLALAVASIVLSSVAFRLPEDGSSVASGNGLGTTLSTGGGIATGAEAADGAAPGSGGRAAGSTVAKAPPGLSCAAGRNGGATDVGVTGTKISLASTVVLDGPAASLLSSSPNGMKAVVNRVNSSGGICGRALDLSVVNDGFDAQKGQLFLRNFMNERKYFAFPVVPSAEGLSSAITSGDIGRAGIPVVGSDGMRIEQYGDPWVWPVATASVSTMRIMAKYGAQAKKARTFAIVWDNKYKFGIEGARAFRDQVKALGGKIKADVSLNPDQPSYASEADAFNNLCQGGCDMVALLLLPDTAEKWLARRPSLGTKLTSGAQTLFTDRFGQACVQAAGLRCNGLVVWTGYSPPIGPLESLPGIARYVNDVRSIDPRADVRNQFLQGSYLGMSVFVEALKRVGPYLTRERLRTVLDEMDFQTDLSSALSWRPGRHHANIRARAFSIVASQGSFVGWRDEQSGWVVDPGFGG